MNDAERAFRKWRATKDRTVVGPLEGETHQHDCGGCRFLGSCLGGHEPGDEHTVDLYYCRSAGGTAIARYSSEGADYASASPHKGRGVPTRGPLLVAYNLAKSKGYHFGYLTAAANPTPWPWYD
tara:strand:+ start:325 stop:696 length:372 start_codon:yes stop_codon:yes gene_type:complete